MSKNSRVQKYGGKNYILTEVNIIMKAYSKRQFAMSDFDRTGYEFNETEGVFTGTLVCKKWGKKRNIVCYVDFDDGRKIICTAFQQQDDYLGLPDIELGARLEFTYQRNKRGINKLIAVKRAE